MGKRDSKLVIEEKKLQIRNHFINGLNAKQIQFMLGMSDCVFSDYMKRIYEEDKEYLAAKKEKSIAFDINLYTSRLQKSLIDLNILYNSPDTSTKEKLEIIKIKCDISDQLIRIDKEGTALMKLNPELEEFIDTTSSQLRNKVQINQIIQNNNYANNKKEKEEIKEIDYEVIV